MASVRAHTCDVPQLQLTVGEACLWRITADRTEMTTDYTPVLTGPTGVASLVPNRPFKAHHGDFVIRGLAPGANELTVTWFYPKTPAGGVCKVTLIVNAPIPGQPSFQV